VASLDARIAFAEVTPEGGADIRAARAEDRFRVARMLSTPPDDWSDADVDLVAFRAMTTLGGPETFKWILPHFLERSIASPNYGWMIVSEVLAEKLDHAGFDAWPEAQQRSAHEMLRGWLAVRPACEEDAELRAWVGRRP
jgi:hypothetical protein